MARPEKRKVDYFPHQIKNGKTLFILESEFGNDGYAFWFKLLEILGQSDNHYYDCSEPGSKRFLVAKVKISEENVDKMLEILYDLKAIDQELWREHEIIWSQNFVDNIAEVYKKRLCEVPSKPCFNENGELPTQKLLAGELPTQKLLAGELPTQKPHGNHILNYTKLNDIKLNKTNTQEVIVEDIKKEKVKKNFDLKSIPYQLAYYLRGKVKEGNKAFIVKGEEQLQSWAYDFDLMIRIDKREPNEIAYIIKFATEDSFWSGNILSASKLRIQYAQLWKKSKGKYDASKPIDIGNILLKREAIDEKRNV